MATYVYASSQGQRTHSARTNKNMFTTCNMKNGGHTGPSLPIPGNLLYLQVFPGHSCFSGKWKLLLKKNT
jgi:hypothetical protein